MKLLFCDEMRWRWSLWKKILILARSTSCSYMAVVWEAFHAFIINGPITWGALEWVNRPEVLAVLSRENSDTEYHAWFLHRSLSHWSIRNTSLWCDLFAHAMPSVLQSSLIVVKPVATSLTCLHMYHNIYEGPKACLGPPLSSRNINIMSF